MFNIHNDEGNFYNLRQAKASNFAINLNPKYDITHSYDCNTKFANICYNKKLMYNKENE
jgi:hypothetical protein